VGTPHFAEVIRQFRQQYPGVTVTIDEKSHYEAIENDLRQGRADVGFSYLPPATSLTSGKLLRDRYIAVLPPGSQTLPIPSPGEALAAYPLILPPADDGDRQHLDRLLHPLGAAAPARLRGARRLDHSQHGESGIGGYHHRGPGG
jgi:DNA-binding transcriptional LysR family regulator